MVFALAGFGKALALLLVENWTLTLWIVFWTFLVRWPDLRPWLARGAWIAVFLLYLIVCITWGVNSGPRMNIEGLPLGSIGEKFLIGGVWVAIAFLCGRVQEVLSLTPDVKEISGPPDGVPTAHGHDDHSAPDDHGQAVAAHGHH